MIFILCHLDTIVEIAQEDYLESQVLVQQFFEDARDCLVALLVVCLVWGQVAVYELEGLPEESYFQACCAFVAHYSAGACLQTAAALLAEVAPQARFDEYRTVQSSHYRRSSKVVLRKDLSQHVFPSVLCLAAEGEKQSSFALLGANEDDIWGGREGSGTREFDKRVDGRNRGEEVPGDCDDSDLILWVVARSAILIAH